MRDSCSDRKLDPGTAATYSNPSDLITSTMKSDPGRSTFKTSTDATGSLSSGNSAAVARCGTGGCAASALPAIRVATVPAAAPFRNPRRSTDLRLDFFMVAHLAASMGGRYHNPKLAVQPTLRRSSSSGYTRRQKAQVLQPASHSGMAATAARKAVTQVTSTSFPAGQSVPAVLAAPGAGIEERSMISKCANPDCSATFDDRCGRFFRFPRPHAPNETPANNHSVWHFWLCQGCAGIYTLV